jgi:uncharacterized repeat protein (TIGR01451 family)
VRSNHLLSGKRLFCLALAACLLTCGGLPAQTFARAAAQSAPAGKIVFVRDADIYVVNSDGTGLAKLADYPGHFTDDAGQIITDMADFPAWSHDGSKIAFVRSRRVIGGNSQTIEDDSYLMVMNADGTNLRSVLSNVGQGTPAWSPDGSKMAVASGHGTVNVFPIAPNGDVQIDPETGEPAGGRIVHGYAAVPAWSPDGTRIALTQNERGDVWVVGDLATVDSNNVAEPGDFGDYATVLAPGMPDEFYPDWSATGHIVYERGDNIFKINPATLEITELTDPGVPPSTGNNPEDSHPSVSADGNQIVFTRRLPSSVHVLYVVNADGTGLRKLGQDIEARNADIHGNVAPPPASGMVDLQLQMTASPAQVAVGQQLTYTITVKNNNATPATGLTVSDSLPAHTEIVSATASQGTCDGTTDIFCQLGTLGPNQTASVQIVVRATEGGTLENTATADANEPEINPADNSKTVSTQALGQCAADLRERVEVTPLGSRYSHGRKLFTDVYQIKNVSDADIVGPIQMGVFHLTDRVEVIGKSGNTTCATPLGSPYVEVLQPWSAARCAPGQSCQQIIGRLVNTPNYFMNIWVSFESNNNSGRFSYARRLFNSPGKP